LSIILEHPIQDFDPASMPSPFFSIVIPTRNESSDILKTLRSIQANTLGDFEVLVVDASTDETPSLVTQFGDARVRLLPQNNRDGRCGARNQGIRDARGEVVVILNADVRLPQDFLERLHLHYQNGADYVIVDSSVENKNHPYGALLEAEHQFLYREGRESVNWCEGYSCRRRCALEAGLFPEKLPVPICAGEDAVFGEKIAQHFKRKEDWELQVSHSVPEEWNLYWAQRLGRGEGCSQRRILLEHWSFSKTFKEGFVCSIKSAFWLILIVPVVWKAQRLSKASPGIPWTQILWPLSVSRIAHELGRWDSFMRLWKKRKSLAA
jgi:glycosyltransferase involved in cell wall biosynthesis